MRLTTTDLEHIQNAQHYFAALRPVGVNLSATDIVRIALRELQNRIGEVGGIPAETEIGEAGIIPAGTELADELAKAARRRRAHALYDAARIESSRK